MHALATATDSCTSQAPARFRIAVERWGIRETDMPDLLRGLNATHPAVAWVSHRSGQPADLIVHLVDIRALVGSTNAAPWNVMGPIHALRNAHRAGTPVVALCRGDVWQLPASRLGCWIVSGTQDFAPAVRTLLDAILTGYESAGETWRGRALELAATHVTFDAS